ncbi:MAG: cyclase family protein [Candidatus Babeliaceae bacterium]|nr:cyclase family protein [Candidatus Babeliaceae bacterium]
MCCFVPRERDIIVDLTHTLDNVVPTWEGTSGFEQLLLEQFEGPDLQFREYAFTMRAGTGTHIDAPAHGLSDGTTVDNLSLATLHVPCVVIDVSACADENFLLSVSEIERFEHLFGNIMPGTLPVIRTGWDLRWFDPDRYRNNLCFPSVSAEAAEALIKRGVVGLAIDTLSPDLPSSGYPVHKQFFTAGKYLVENVANSSLMPPVGGYVIILPLKLLQGAEAPVRMIGVFQEN